MPVNVTTQQQSFLCGSGSTLLQVNSSVLPAQIKWHAGITDTAVLATGYSYTTNILTGTDTFWVSVDSCNGPARLPVIVSVYSPSSTVQNVSAIDSFLWAATGRYYTASGTYSDTLVNAMGCDSIITLHLYISLGISSVVQNKELMIVPNPTHNTVVVYLPQMLHNATIQVRNVLGKVVMQRDVNAKNSLPLDLSPLANGVYFIECSGGAEHYVGKVVKQ